MKELQAVDYYSIHKGEPTLVIGNGPSANQIKDYTQVIKNKYITIGMNRSWQLIDADYHVIMFHREHLDDLVKYKYPLSTLWCFKDYCEMWVREIEYGNVVYVPSVADPKDPMHQFNLAGMISLDLSENSYADMTGMFALEVALWMRCDPIYLIGFDLYGGHFCDKEKPEDEWRDIQVEIFDMTCEQVADEASWASVYNCNPESRITQLPKVKFEDIL